LGGLRDAVNASSGDRGAAHIRVVHRRPRRGLRARHGWRATELQGRIHGVPPNTLSITTWRVLFVRGIRASLRESCGTLRC